jgi:hypothetical protein
MLKPAIRTFTRRIRHSSGRSFALSVTSNCVWSGGETSLTPSRSRQVPGEEESKRRVSTRKSKKRPAWAGGGIRGSSY